MPRKRPMRLGRAAARGAGCGISVVDEYRKWDRPSAGVERESYYRIGKEDTHLAHTRSMGNRPAFPRRPVSIEG